MNAAFWLGRRVLLTGHTGFKGSWLSLWLQQLGAELSGFALSPPSQPSLFDAAGVAAGMRHQLGDVRDLAALQQAMQAAQPELVIHMAAQSLVRPSYEDPVGTYATNVMGTVNLLEAVRGCPSVRAVLVVTTDKCYENQRSSQDAHWGFREHEPMGGHDPYSNSKGCAELVCAAYRSSFLAEAGVQLATARAGNVIGGGDWARDRLLPDVLQAWSAGTPVRLRSPHAIRPWQHVLEPLRGYLMLAGGLLQQGTACAEAWNFGPRNEDARPVAEVVAGMAKLWGEGAQWSQDPGQHPHEAAYLKLDTSKADSQLHWQPRLGLHEALALVVDWQRRFAAGESARALTLEQINAYL
jgi:CDP-glucose 4,6-dehydratase